MFTESFILHICRQQENAGSSYSNDTFFFQASEKSFKACHSIMMLDRFGVASLKLVLTGTLYIERIQNLTVISLRSKCNFNVQELCTLK